VVQYHLNVWVISLSSQSPVQTKVVEAVWKQLYKGSWKAHQHEELMYLAGISSHSHIPRVPVPT